MVELERAAEFSAVDIGDSANGGEIFGGAPEHVFELGLPASNS